MAVIAQDNFDRADSPTLGANWTAYSTATSAQIVSNAIENPAANVFCGNWYNAATWPNDHYSQLIFVAAVLGNDYIIPSVRMNTGTARTSYHFLASGPVPGTNTALIVRKEVAGVLTNLGTRTATLALGDTMRLDGSGTTLRARQNGNQLGADITDSAIASGVAGLQLFESILPLTDDIADNWEGGDFTAAGYTLNRRSRYQRRYI